MYMLSVCFSSFSNVIRERLCFYKQNQPLPYDIGKRCKAHRTHVHIMVSCTCAQQHLVNGCVLFKAACMFICTTRISDCGVHVCKSVVEHASECNQSVLAFACTCPCAQLLPSHTSQRVA